MNCHPLKFPIHPAYRGGEAGAKALRYIAFYLPQFRRLNKNDATWGEGFTEWSNVFRGVPVFDGHKQPRLPRKDWLYSLENEDVLVRQSQLARAHGIDGFAHYLYWFDDEVLLSETPTQHANDHRVEIDFCFVWANENWTRKWDGRDEEVVVPQHYRYGYATRLAEHVAPFMKSGKYIYENGRPLFIVYAPSKIPDLQQFAREFRDEITRATGLNPYLVCAETFGFHAEPTSIGFDASVEFPPHSWPDEELRELRQHVSLTEIDSRPSIGSHPQNTSIFSYPAWSAIFASRQQVNYRLFRSVMLEWDNTSRSPIGGSVFQDFSYGAFSSWLMRSSIDSMGNSLNESGLVFINAWNEWAEGTVLEPREDDGLEALQAVQRTKALVPEILNDSRNIASFSQDSAETDFVCAWHSHYVPDDSVLDGLQRLVDRGVALVGTATSLELKAYLQNTGLFSRVWLVENRGRDIRPFLALLPSLREKGFKHVLKLHDKRSVQIGDAGRKWGAGLIQGYLDPDVIDFAMSELSKNPSVGALCAGQQIAYTSHSRFWAGHSPGIEAIATISGIPDLASRPHPSFAAGSMFWASLEALEPFERIPDHWFELENPHINDSRIEHAVERSFLTVVELSGQNITLLGGEFPPIPYQI